MDDKPAAPLLTAEDADLWLRHTSGDTGSPDSPLSKVRRLVRFIASGETVCVPAVAAPEPVAWTCPTRMSNGTLWLNGIGPFRTPDLTMPLYASPGVVLAPPEDEKEKQK